MSRLAVPIAGKVLFPTGDVRLWAELELLLKDSAGNWHLDALLVDTGTELTTYPAYEAKRLGLAIPQQPNPGVTHRQTGLEIRPGCLRFRIVGMDPTEYVLAALFLGDPDTPPDPRQLATFPRKLLQPFWLLDELRFLAEKDPAAGTLYGELVVEKR